MNRVWRCIGAVTATVMLAAASLPVRAAADEVFPRFDTPRQLRAACDRLQRDLREWRRRVPQADDAQLLPALDALQRREDETLGPITLLASVHPEAPMRAEADACKLRHQAPAAAFLQDARVYRRLSALQPADGVDGMLRRDWLDAMEDAGVALPPKPRADWRLSTRRIAAAVQDFERRVRDGTPRVAFVDAELDGVPADVWRSLPTDARGRRQLRLDAPTYQALMQHAHNAATRERTWRAMQNAGGDANLRTLAGLSRLRRYQATLLGQPSHAAGVLRRRMAHDEAQVASFLDEVGRAVAARERDDLQMLREALAREVDRPVGETPLQRWDVAYQLERVRRERYDVDTGRLREHFPPKAAAAGVMRLAERLFGLRFAAAPRRLWHPSAESFDVFDASSNRRLGVLLLDLYPRPGKYGHAAVWGVRSANLAAGQPAVAALVTNLDDKGLSPGDLETLLHEFGHAMHALLSPTRHAAHNGLNTPLDFVEAPSQMLEDWAYDPKVLAWMFEGCTTCRPVPPETLAKLERARELGKGIEYARQVLYARYDLALYGRTPHDPMTLWAQLEAATPLGHVAGTRFPAAFEHVAGHYAGGYYSYLWSLALAEDLRTAFAADRLSAAVGHRYRNEVLAPGAERPPAESIARFLGRPTSRDAFFRSLVPR